MKRKTIGTLLALMTMAVLTSCGAKNDIAAAAMGNSKVTIATETGLIVEDAPIELEIETEDVEPIYTEYRDLFLADNFSKLNTERLEAVDEYSLEEVNEIYFLSESTDLYNFEGTWMGYSKPDIRVTLFKMSDKWAEVSFADYVLYVPKESFDKATVEELQTEEVLLAEAEEPTANPKTETVPVTSEPVAVEPSTTEPVVTESVPAEPEPIVDNTKYTPEEAIAVYRSIMEANGISWNPSLKNGGSWGTGWIYLTKGQPEWSGNSAVESYRMGDGDGILWDCYYLEVTGSDENAVYITEWHP